SCHTPSHRSFCLFDHFSRDFDSMDMVPAV
ncbi:MAG: hypothetical protein ACI85S_000926, partial [Pseudohongiellaceae bacterium]